MTLNANQVFLVLLVIAAARGYARGWHREIITCAITLGSVLFLTIGGGDALAQLITNAPNLIRGTGPGVNFATATPNPWVNAIILVGFTVLGHFGGSHYGTAPKITQHRLSGMLAGSVTGLALVYYITRQLLPSTTFNATSPSTALATSWIIGLFGIGMMFLLFLALVRK
jgi:hypothetical protein